MIDDARTSREPARRLPHRVRQAVLTVHIVSGVGLLGDSAGFLAVAVRGTTTGNPSLEAASYELLRMFSYLFGIPLSLLTLATGLVLSFGTAWGVFRSPWVTAKLVLLLSVLAVGGLAIDPALDSLRGGQIGSEATLVAAAAWQVLALAVATTLSVYKPGGRKWTRRHRARRSAPAAAPLVTAGAAPRARLTLDASTVRSTDRDLELSTHPTIAGAPT